MIRAIWYVFRIIFHTSTVLQQASYVTKPHLQHFNQKPLDHHVKPCPCQRLGVSLWPFVRNSYCSNFKSHKLTYVKSSRIRITSHTVLTVYKELDCKTESKHSDFLELRIMLTIDSPNDSGENEERANVFSEGLRGRLCLPNLKLNFSQSFVCIWERERERYLCSYVDFLIHLWLFVKS